MKPYYESGPVTLYHGASEVVMKSFADSSVDAIVTDPPYELGFMGKGWDSSGIAYSVELWSEALRVLKPGGHLLAFGGSRTFHRMAVAIEDSGFELRDSIAWLYGSGFPKSMDVSSAIDKLDATRERRGRALRFTAFIRQHLTAAQVNEITGTLMGSHYVTDKEQPHVATAEYFDMLRPHLPEVPPEIEQLVADRTVESQNWRSREVTGSTRSQRPRRCGGLGCSAATSLVLASVATSRSRRRRRCGRAGARHSSPPSSRSWSLASPWPARSRRTSSHSGRELSTSTPAELATRFVPLRSQPAR